MTNKKDHHRLKLDTLCCRGCGSKGIDFFFDLGDQPLANALRKDKNGSEKTYPLILGRCPSCTLIQISFTVSPDELFSSYVWLTGTSDVAVQYSEMFRDRVMGRYNTSKHCPFVLEIACNDGTFLKPFQQYECRVLGVDPAVNICRIAEKKGLPVHCGFFNESLANEIKAKQGTADIVIARNVLPHVADLSGVLTGVEMLINDNGLFVVEIHDGLGIFNDLQYDSVYHEHLCYYTLTSFKAIVEKQGLYVVDIEESPISGGSMVIYLKKKTGTIL